MSLRADLPPHILRADLPPHILRADLPPHIVRVTARLFRATAPFRW
jgi:hypothetical protein